MNLDEALALRGLAVRMLEMTEQEARAWLHAKERVEVDGAHKIYSCPYPCRAMCRFRKEIESMRVKGIEVPE